MSLLKFVIERREKLHLRPVRCELMTKAWSRQAARKEMGNKTNGGGATLVGEHRRVEGGGGIALVERSGMRQTGREET
jgi:hypothetical protein